MSTSSRLGWLALPAFLAILTLVGLGVSTEGRTEFERRTTEAGGDGTGDRLEQIGPEQSEGAQPLPEQGGDGADVADGSQTNGDDQRMADITVATETGEIIIGVDEDGRPLRLTPVGPDGTGAPIDIDPDDLVAIRLGEDGRLEVIPLDEVGPDDTIVAPADGGFDLRRPDGSIVEFRADGENGGITATEIAPDGRATELEPGSDGSVTLSDGTTVGPIDVVDELGPVERLIERTRELPWPLLVAGLVLLVLGSAALALYLHRKRSDETFDFGQLASSGVPDGRFEQFLDALRRDPDPSRAIRVGFSVAEQGLGGIPGRRADETPFEWHRRVGEGVGEGSEEIDRILGRVCDLFARARFAPGRSTDADRQAMVDALRDLHRRGRDATVTGQGPIAGDDTGQPERQDA